MIPRSRTASLLALGAICLTGCASEEQPVQKLKPLALKEQVSHIVKSADGYAVTWAGVLSNANPWHFGEHVVATIVGHDAKGSEVLKLDQPLDAVPPGGTLPFTGQAVATQKPAKVTIQYRPARWRPAARIPSAFQRFPISRVQTMRQKDGTYLITGYVGNPYQISASSLVVNAMLRDKAGKLVGGGSTYVDDVKAGSPPRFILTVGGLPRGSQVARTEIAARTWGSTGRPYEDLALSGAVPVHTVKPTSEPFAVDRNTQVASEHKQ
ncbi:hypothetical protein AB0M50_19685 [Nonomuraea fuscirosea]|uniref:Lipoprotein LprG n=1 Tax=Nonomuraea fuscirosea TaxID=1291556 RepID=A0A2T0MXN8_9ACTN|nr:hypothetical protein [Nonomuraea fuscirosea]PRX63865.1 hypothetical protein B0I32_110319 [Nonomuraea fuscirosea]WSA51362.1 hypothetical protein OIE67_46180 [Nonomuraea fuscirosea]